MLMLAQIVADNRRLQARCRCLERRLSNHREAPAWLLIAVGMALGMLLKGLF